jgi:hypothetical protein
MNDNGHDSDRDPNPWWDYVEPECRWVPQCRRLLIPGGCDDCEYLRNDVLRDEDGDPWVIARDPAAR